MAFTQKSLGAKIQLAQGAFAEGGNNVTLPSGLRMKAELQNAGGLSDGTMNLVIYGMTDSLMKQLSTLGMQVNLVPKNPITLLAGADGPKSMSVAFVGYIIAAYADYNAQPDICFHIEAHTLAAFGGAPAEASSFKGPADVATIMAGFAANMGLRFENSGVTTKLPSSSFTGSLRDQARKCVKDAGISWNAGEGGVLAIWPKTGSRNGQMRLIAPPPKGSMIGFPTYTAYGIMVRNLYDPTIGYGTKVRVESSVLTPGEWQVYGLSHRLESETASGAWESTILGYNPKHPTPPVR